jgi:endonuclease/exonuclease/phosphatase family metal-dependent hydrolase
VGLLVRTWNVFHGRTFPESRETHLEGMVRLATGDSPDVVALQEVPLWALDVLGAWSGMRVVAVVTKRGLLGPLAHGLQALEPRLVRSPLTGQANALLLGSRLSRVGEARSAVVSPAGARERRVCQAVTVTADGGEIVVVNLHTSADREQVGRAVVLLGGAGRCVLCGDFNLRSHHVPGFSEPGEGIDQILVRGLEFERRPAAWPDERRRLDSRLLSDHAPLEAVIA